MRLLFVSPWVLGLFWLLLLLGGRISESRAQGEYLNWYFAPGNGITFTGPQPLLLAGNPAPYPSVPGQLQTLSTISDSVGRVQFVTDGNYVWDRTGQLMPNGRAIGAGIATSNNVSPGGDLALPIPGSPGRYFILQYGSTAAMPYACPDFYYSVVNMRRRGGLGDVEGPARPVLLPPFPATSGSVLNCLRSNVEAVRHANGRDLWLVFRNGDDKYFSYLLNAAGIAPQAVQSNATPKTGLVYGARILKASADSHRLAFAEGADGTLDIEEFDAATGQVRPQYRLKGLHNTSALALSPDGSKLYLDTLGGHLLWQYDLAAGPPAAVQASRLAVAMPRCSQGADLQDLQLGPDGCLYVQLRGPEYVGRVRFPNVPGRGCRFEEEAVYVGPKRAYTLVRLPNDLNLPPARIQAGSTAIASGNLLDSVACGDRRSPTAPGPGPVCQYKPTYFYAATAPFLSASSYDWNFGDPSSGPRNQGSGQAPSHQYASAGTYQVQVKIQFQDGRQQAFALSVEVQECRPPLPNIITPNGDRQNQSFVLEGLRALDWTVTIYNRWGREVYRREGYDNRWEAAGQAAGTYYYMLHNPTTGQRLRGWVEVVK